MRLRDLLFGSVRPAPAAVDLALLIARVAAGLSIALFHGRGKVPPSDGFVSRVEGMGFPAPEAFAWLAGLAEFGGGLLLALGLLARPAALLLVVQFCFVVFLAHAGDPIGDRELPFVFGAVALHFLLTGPGRFSIDALLTRRRR